MSQTMTLKPRMTEKTYLLSKQGVYVFDVPSSSNKALVASAVEKQFDVKVDDVRLLVAKGKTARSIRLGGIRKQVYGRRPDIKKAYVALEKGQELPIFAEVEKAEEEEKKAAEKAEKKEAKKTTKAKTEGTKDPKSIQSKEKKTSPDVAAKGNESFARRFFRRKK